VRITLVSPYAFSVHGGVQEQVLAQSRELVRRGHDVLVVAPDSDDQAALDTPARVVRLGKRLVLPANGSRAPLTLSFTAARRAARVMADFAPDVVHFHEPLAPLVGWRVLRRHRVASVGTFHRSGGGPAVSLTRPLLKWLARHLDETVAVSDMAAATMGAASGTSPTVLFNGFETERFRAFPRGSGTEVVLLVLGRLEERKGVAVAIEAVRSHNDSASTPWRLIVVGEGPEGSRLRALAADDPAIVFTGAVSDEEKRRWLRQATVLVAPALRGESFGLILLEAFASETPVVASAIDGYTQAAGGHAQLFAPGDASALARAVEEACAKRSDTTIAAARAHADEWSMERLVDRYLALYERAQERFRATR